MDKTNEKQTGFYQTDLEIEYLEYPYVEPSQISKRCGYTVSHKAFDQFLFVVSGKFEIAVGGKSFIVDEGAVVTSPVGKSFNFRRITPNAERLTVYFHRSLFENNGESNFLRVFENALECEAFYPITFENLSCYETLNSLMEAVFKKRNRFCMLTKLQSIILELNFEYDKTLEAETHDKSNVTLSVIEYVRNNYIQSITLKTLRDEFFISNSTINRIFQRAVDCSFREYLNRVRVLNANEMIKDGKASIYRIAEMSGYKTYSTFYREYVRVFGYPPAQNKQKRLAWPLDKQ